MKSSDLLARCLEHEGVEWVFGIPGEETLDVMDSIISSQVKFVLTKHESSAAFMAETVGRLTRRPGVCLSTLGPGAANLVGGVADAQLSYAPMVAFAGQRNGRLYDPPSKQVIDLVSLFKPITKDSFTMRNVDNLPVLVRKAFDTAVAERPGPVFMELPEDLMKQETAATPQPGHPFECVRPERSSLHQLGETIKEADSPLVLAGQGVVRARASEALAKFCHAWNLPVVHTWMANGAVPSDDRCSLNTVGARTNDRLRKLYEKSDLVILVGTELMEFPPPYWNIGRKKEAIYFGQVPLDHFMNFVPEVQVIGGLRYILDGLAEIGRTRPAWHGEVRDQVQAQLAETGVDGKDNVHPKNIVLAIRKALGREDIVCCDVGAHMVWMVQCYPAYRENTCLIPYGLIPMGIGLPSAMAAKMVNPERKVVAAVGDAGFQMTVAELETAKRLGLALAVVIFNDQGLGLIKDKMQKLMGRQSGMDFLPIDYVKLAESFGAEGHEVKTSAALSSTLDDVLKRDVLAVIDVKVDYCHNHCVIP